jgi:hypothetical protein
MSNPSPCLHTPLCRSVLDFDTEEALSEALQSVRHSASPTAEASQQQEQQLQQKYDAVAAEKLADWQVPLTSKNASVADERRRLWTLRSMEILETDRDDAFDRLTAQVRTLCQAPLATLSFVDLGRQWTKSFQCTETDESSKLFAGLKETPRFNSFAAYTILELENILVVPDTLQDERFAHNPLVHQGPIRFYAGAALVSAEGDKIGSLCILDTQPRPQGLSAVERQGLLAQAAVAVRLLLERKEKQAKNSSGSSLKRTSSQVNSSSVSSSSSLSSPPTAFRLDDFLKDKGCRNTKMAGQTNNHHRWSLPPAVEADARSLPPRLVATKSTATVPQPAAPPGATSPGSGRIIKKSRSMEYMAVRGDTPSNTCPHVTASNGTSSGKGHNDPTIHTIIPRPCDPSSLPDPKKSGVDPDQYLAQLVQALWGVSVKVQPALELKDYFETITEQQMAAYNMEVVTITRQNNVEKLRELFEARGRDSLDCFNRFGEGLLNMACRRGMKEIVQFLLSDAVQLNVRVRDDYGRTPMHDACWNPEPQLEICSWIMAQDPSLFLISDKRGYTPFQYARKSDWQVWRQFLFDHREHLQALAQPDLLTKFS